jgi:hypothetical protein
MSAPLIERECIPHTFCLFLVNKSFVWRQTLLEEARYPQPSSRGASEAREPGTHTPGPWLWIPALALLGRDDGVGCHTRE